MVLGEASTPNATFFPFQGQRLLHHFVCTTLFAPLCLHHFVAPLCLHHFVCTTLLHHFVYKNTENGSLVGTMLYRSPFSIFVGAMLYRVLFSRGFPRMYFLETSPENTFGNVSFQQHPLGIPPLKSQSQKCIFKNWSLNTF